MANQEKETSEKKSTEVRNETEAAPQHSAEDKQAAPSRQPEDSEETAVPEGNSPSQVSVPDADAADQAENPEEAQVAAVSEAQTAADMPVSPSADHMLPSDAPVVPKMDDPQPIEGSSEEKTEANKEQTSATDEDDEHEDDEDHPDYSHLSKKKLVAEAEHLMQEKDLRKADKLVHEIKHYLEEFQQSERQEALERFVEEGGDANDFDYRGDALDHKFDQAFRYIRDAKNRHYQEQQKMREDNLSKKNEVLANLRELVDSEETNASLKEIKEIQERWKAIGPVPSAYNANLWANYNALLDRFYNNRSILFELKELDRRKNLEMKQDIVARAEKLLGYENLKQATRELRELHEEFRHIGPVPREEQEALWERFKALSDQVYDKRRSHLENLNKELEENLIKKRELGDRVQSFIEFTSDRISDWNEKTKELLGVQKEWETIGGLPRQVAKEVNKYFWSAFKGFFSNKNRFFRSLEKLRQENLAKKEAIVTEAEQIKDSEDWQSTAERFKQLQKQWRDIGPVPEKQREAVYKAFKAAADAFFDRKRQHAKTANKEYEVNLERKQEVIKKIEALSGSGDVEKFQALQEAFDEIGYVPRNAISKVKNGYSEAVDKYLNTLEDMPEEEREKLRLRTQLQSIRNSPDSDRKLRQKEQNIKRQIGKIENDIGIWKNNLEFFADSKNADALKKNFEEKIDEAQEQLTLLKQQLRIVHQES